MSNLTYNTIRARGHTDKGRLQFACRVPPELFAVIKAHAIEQGLPINEVVVRALKERFMPQ